MASDRPYQHGLYEALWSVNGHRVLVAVSHGELRDYAIRVGDKWQVVRIGGAESAVREPTEVSDEDAAIALLWERHRADPGEEPAMRRARPGPDNLCGDAPRRVPFDVPDSGPMFSAYELRRPIACIGASRGDFLIYSHWLDGRPEMYGRVRELGPEDYEVLRGLNLQQTMRGVGSRSQFFWLESFLGHRGRWGKQLKVFYSRLLLLKPWGSPVSKPVLALSDESAIYELLHQTGCKLPEEA